MSTPGEVASPCIDVCRIGESTGWCDGCQRTLEEIAAWRRLSNDEKRAVWQSIELRREQLRRSEQP